MSLRKLKGLARTPPGVVKGFNVGLGDVSRVSTFHSVEQCESRAMGAPLLSMENDGYNPVHSCFSRTPPGTVKSFNDGFGELPRVSTIVE